MQLGALRRFRLSTHFNSIASMLGTLSYQLVFYALQAAAGSIRGVEEDLQHLYKPLESDSTKWACLSDPSIVLSYSQINDDYCDCPDGSDEPGTGACGELSRFYCQNDGFAPRYVAGFKVGDGVCDCCDCSDEPNGATAAPFTCSQLHDQFNTLVKRELEGYENGVTALRKLERRHGLDSNKDNTVNQRSAVEKLEVEADIATRNHKACVAELAATKESYHDKLQQENPLMLRLEQLDISSITNTIHDIFSQAEYLSTAYQQLIKILDTLKDTYNPNLNDDVVNRNMQRFDHFMQSHKKDSSVSANLDRTQREQIITYINEELPEMFLKGSTHLPPEAIQGKFGMARTLVDIKLKYCESMVDTLQALTAIMDDISANHNVNFQDSGVKSAVTTYRDFLAKNARISEPLQVSKENLEKIENLETLVQAAARQLLNPSWEGKKTFATSFNGLLRNLYDTFGIRKSSLSAVKSKIMVLEQKCAALRREYRGKTASLKDITEQSRLGAEDPATSDLLHQNMNKLLAKLAPDSIQQKVDNYVYQISLSPESGTVIQKEDKPGGNQVVIGRFDTHGYDQKSAFDRYTNDLRLEYSDSDLITHLESDLADLRFELRMGNLPEKDSGLILQYSHGDKCWNGPARSAQIYLRCAQEFKIHSVQEPTRCHYTFDISGPLGCNPNFRFIPPHWL
ncbi:LADA_0D07074g1_1 [Lachancea dasiensis]|uniref:Glucosidase 2 subunit beta n=1 Tax=Lachancea dasiensis TaxID=1072105 RepID=A0A1G4J6K8_9SACH|nr:LADA_0D07074g1_1 [Lachancea dasiensis]